ncbi:MAG: DUF4159 domain-containing protein [Planctomyces sp.]
MYRTLSILLCIVVLSFCASQERMTLAAEDDNISDVELRDRIRRAMDRGCDFLRRTQNEDGSWHNKEGLYERYAVGLTSLAIMAQLNCDVPPTAPEIQKGLSWLRNLPAGKPTGVYETSLLLMALTAAEQPDRDLPRVRQLSGLLEKTQETQGIDAGLWGYDIEGRGDNHRTDRSNGQYAILALRDASYFGVNISQDTWKRTHTHWTTLQAQDGGWSYTTNGNPTGSMTAAGLSTVAITTRMIEDDSDVDEQGRPDCCSTPQPDTAMEKGRQWMARNFKVNSNPKESNWHYYYLYGLERAGRLSNVRFFGQHDWYREGARFFISSQLASGDWISQGGSEKDAVMSTSMALLFLSKGLSRVVVNKLDYTSLQGESVEQGEWNRHPLDVINLVDLIDSLPGWPPRLISQTITLSRLKNETAVVDLNQAPVLFVSGRDAPQLNDEQVRWLREYVDEGGFIFACANCDGKGFDAEFRRLVTRMFPRGDAALRRLTAEHPVFRSQYPLNADTTELWGVDFGCRTAVIYSPDDLGCLWQKWRRHNSPDRNNDLVQRVSRGTSIGVNVLAYATGREPPEKLHDDGLRNGAADRRIERGLLQIAKLRYSGSWDTAPRALGNLLKALNTTVGVAAAPRSESIPITLDQLSRFPLVYMHGRDRFHLPQAQTDALRDYLNRGGFLFADSCCGAPGFDQSFRDLAQQLFPELKLIPIPPGHELYSDAIGHQIRQVTRRKLISSERDASLQTVEEKGPPQLEGIEIDGRLAVVYSRYDISCALEHQASLACDGYLEEDAARIAVNVVLYSLLQNISWSPIVNDPTGTLRKR